MGNIFYDMINVTLWAEHVLFNPIPAIGWAHADIAEPRVSLESSSEPGTDRYLFPSSPSPCA